MSIRPILSLLIVLLLRCLAVGQAAFPLVVSYNNPGYPAAARAVRASGLVIVSAVVDEDGRVISATATAGHTLLKKASEVAASRWIFSAVPGTHYLSLRFEYAKPVKGNRELATVVGPYAVRLRPRYLEEINTTDYTSASK